MKVSTNITSRVKYAAGDLIITSDDCTFLLFEDSYKSYAVNMDGFVEYGMSMPIEELVENIIINNGVIVKHVPSEVLKLVRC